LNRIVPGGRLTRLDLLVLALVALLGLANLPIPFTWDQSIFVLGAKAMSHGAVLYRDFWDTKQPGVFLFYLAGGRLFGFTEVGVHLFELVWQLAFAVAILVTLRRHFEHRAFASLAALFAVGLYYAVANDAKLTQVEALVGFPILLALWAALPDDEHTPPHPGRYLFSGLMGAVVLVFKLMFAPIVGAFWVIALVDALARRRATFGQAAVRMVLPVAVGVVVPLALVWGYFTAHGTWEFVWWTWTKFPLQVVTQAKGFRLDALVEGLSWFVFRFGPLVAVGLVGAVASFDMPRRARTTALVAWLALGAGIILSQRVSWWPYQYLLLVAPTGILAARGIDFVWTLVVRGAGQPGVRLRACGIAVIALLVSGAIGAQGLKTFALARTRFALDPAHRERFQSLVATQMPYALVRREMAFLSQPGSLPGSIYVIGNPLFSYFSGREDAGTRNAAILTHYVSAAEWDGMTRRLAERRPAYIFIEKQMLPILEEHRDRVAPFFALLAERYVLLKQTDRGSWFVRTGPPR
jgi:hypothetical protein